MAKKLLEQLQIDYKEISIDNNNALREEMISLSGRKTVPQIFLDNNHIGGYDDLHDSYKLGKLNKYLNKN